MGAHKYNPVAIAAKNGELPPKTKKLSKREKRIISYAENTDCFRKIAGVAPSDLVGQYADELMNELKSECERSLKNVHQRFCEILCEEDKKLRDPLLEEGKAVHSRS